MPTCETVHYKGCSPKHLLPIGQRSPKGPLGTVGMVGNAWEWIADWYAKDYYARAPEKAPRGPATGTRRVIRGGSYYDPPHCLRCRSRYHWKPGARLTDVGFRCVKE
jgi:formylglycine-generating enzyme required for sulfatase activity